MKRVITGILSVVLLTGCGQQTEVSSKYASENEKLQVYTENVAKAIRANVVETMEDEDELNAAEFREAIPYIEAFRKDIDRNRLTEDKQDLYDELLEGMTEYDSLVKAAKKGDNSMYEKAMLKVDGDKEFLNRAKVYEGSQGDKEYVSVPDLQE